MVFSLAETLLKTLAKNLVKNLVKNLAKNPEKYVRQIHRKLFDKQIKSLEAFYVTLFVFILNPPDPLDPF